MRWRHGWARTWHGGSSVSHGGSSKDAAAPLLRVRDLSVAFAQRGGGVAHVLDQVSFDVRRGETLGLVGESGCGKSITLRAILGVEHPGVRVGGEVLFRGEDIAGAARERLNAVRGSEIGIVFQDAGMALSPVLSVGSQLTEILRLKRNLKRSEAVEEAVRLLDRVGIPAPERRINDYPHQLSGGMRQRAMIALALAPRPEILLADEPTTALDVTIQDQVLRLLASLRSEEEMALILVSHDLGVIAQECDSVAVMNAGRVVEYGTVDEILEAPRHAVTREMLAVTHMAASEMSSGESTDAELAVNGVVTRAGDDVVLEIEDLHVTFGGRRTMSEVLRRSVARRLMAVDGISVDVRGSRTLGIVGESGSGKSTLAKALVRLIEPDAGTVRFRGEDILKAGDERLRQVRRMIQLIYQDPASSLNPRMTIADAIAEAARVHELAHTRAQAAARAAELLERVGLSSALASRYPRALSGGQRQRVAIARALACAPEVIVADEITSALDVAIQAQIVDLLDEMRRELGLTVLFISHDLPLVGHVADEVAVMYLGRVVERGPVSEVFDRPAHPYTAALLSAQPSRERRSRKQAAVRGEIPSGFAVPSGCRFRTRCPMATDICKERDPPEVRVSAAHSAWCHFAQRVERPFSTASVSERGVA